MQLQQYLDRHRIPVVAFAAQLGVTIQTVYRYQRGERLPAAGVMQRIFLATGGKVAPNDFYLRRPQDHARHATRPL
jgi:transcriptional regulator with XRE-family HTH domain